MASHYYSWNDRQIHYIRKGMGDPILLVHNLYPGASTEEFQYNIDELAKTYTVYAIDLLGFGESDAPWMKYTANTYVSLICDFLNEEIRRRAHVMVSGMSCAYVSQVAAWRPELVDRLVFVCPRSDPVGFDAPRWIAPLQRLLMATPLGSGLYNTVTCEYELASFLQGCYFNQRQITPDKVRQLHKNASLRGSMYTYASLMTGFLDCDIFKSMPHVDAPILLIWGRQAKPSPVEHSVRLTSIAPRCQLHVIENAGAWVHDEQSAQVNRMMKLFLNNELPAASDVG